jgi:hypothetical protein
MRTYNKKYKRIKLADSEKISSILIESIRIHFPIQHEETIESILEFIDDRLKIQFDIDLLETELLKATRKIKFQMIIKNYFNALRNYYTGKTEPNTIVIQTFNRHTRNIPIVKPLKQISKEIEVQDLHEIKERWDEVQRIRKKLSGITKIWTETHTTTWGNDPLTPPPLEE